ncbi:MAG: hypothetical protein LBK54_07175 [Propionibacteriaceae bacterium]|jgi:hypothetical protein|nr:hypothetical protein [Propionibacteriaceae bacterium]
MGREFDPAGFGNQVESSYFLKRVAIQVLCARCGRPAFFWVVSAARDRLTPAKWLSLSSAKRNGQWVQTERWESGERFLSRISLGSFPEEAAFRAELTLATGEPHGPGCPVDWITPPILRDKWLKDALRAGQENEEAVRRLDTYAHDGPDWLGGSDVSDGEARRAWRAIKGTRYSPWLTVESMPRRAYDAA